MASPKGRKLFVKRAKAGKLRKKTDAGSISVAETIAHNKRMADKYLATHKPIEEKLTLTGRQRNWLYQLLASLSKDPNFFDRNDRNMVNSVMSSLSLHYDSDDD